ncbi:hypothetical protein [Hymenobacter sp. GOD-10R]|uniref:hypothetical protein n=1 Tax=Hymenobacter sp. GOD-10R TaxID=3093922 RepID=UPI002D79C2E6|nr:hypothetical protein [Hymenobacter sp. GOD-10R]WRQ27348.1 hypothetical protein SD425_19945 [Hymenobacter sp. GOD-10R]
MPFLMPYYSTTNRFQEFHAVGLLAVWLLAGCAGYAASILYSVEVGEVLALARRSSPNGHALSTTQVAFEQLRLGLGTTACVLGMYGVVVFYDLHRQGLVVQHFWRTSGLRAKRGLFYAWYALRPRQQRWTLAAFAALTVLRIIVSRRLVTFDDSASYEFFVRDSLLTVSAYYPAPNNHIFSNTLSWLFYQVCQEYWWSMRVPVLLASTAATAYWFLGLLRCSNFRVAALTVMLCSLLELNLFLAAEGRGYALLFALSALGFFSALSLTDAEAPTPKRAWAGMAVAGIIGLYTVPTFAYFLVAAYSWLGFCWLCKGDLHRLVAGVLLGATTLVGAALLYAPLLLISGPGALFRNAYVKPLAVSTFFQRLPAYVWEVEGGLLGESRNGVLASVHLGSLAAGAVVIGFLALARAAQRGRLPAHQVAYVLRLGVPALWFVVMPYLLLVMQRVEAPSRTLAFKATFMFLLIGLELDWVLHQFGPRVRHLRTTLRLGIGLWAGVQLTQLYRSNELRLSYLRTPHLAAQWLLNQPAGPILAPNAPCYLPALRFYIHFEKPTSTLEIDDAPKPGTRYRYIINPPAPFSGALPHLHVGRDVNCEAMDIVSYW